MRIYFKLFSSIKDEHEVELAKLEIERLIGPVKSIRNFVDELVKKPLNGFMNKTHGWNAGDNSDKIRFQDFLLHETTYGMVQGFVSEQNDIVSIQDLITRLGYTREIYAVLPKADPEETKKKIFKKSILGKNCDYFISKDHLIFRAITNQYYLENCEYVLKITPTLGREKVDFFAARMFQHLNEFIYRIPASAKARVGKRFLDYLAERDEPSRYLSHGLHPYKGKFHPKMIRALINIIYPNKKGTLIDNFAGSGTLLVEASLMGLDSFGVEINPMSVLMTNAKCALLQSNPQDIDNTITRFLSILNSELEIQQQENLGQTTLTTSNYDVDQSELSSIKELASDVYDDFAIDDALSNIVLARIIIEQEFKGNEEQILKLGLAIVISDMKGKKKKNDFVTRIQFVMEDIYRRSRLLHILKQKIPLTIGKGKAFQSDSSNFGEIKEISKIGGNINSPPYSTALDYIKNDLSQLVLLGFVRSKQELQELENKMGGNPRIRYDKTILNQRINNNEADLPEYAIALIRLLRSFDKTNHAFRLYEFYVLMKKTIAEQMRVLKKGAKFATVIGNNHFKLTDSIEVVSDEMIEIDSFRTPVKISEVVNKVRVINTTPISGKTIKTQYSDSLPIKVSLTEGSQNSGQNGVYVEVENERVILLLGQMIGFEPEMVINRYLEKSRRGNIRYEAIIVLKKP